jgi:hypothetical protein
MMAFYTPAKLGFCVLVVGDLKTPVIIECDANLENRHGNAHGIAVGMNAKL